MALVRQMSLEVEHGSVARDRPRRHLMGRLLSLNPDYDNIALRRPVLLLGRGPRCDVQFVDARISGQHCRVNVTSTGASVTDLSTNGTWVNKQKLGKGNQRTLNHGDELALILARSRHSTLGLRRCAFVYHDMTLLRGDLFVREMAKHKEVTNRYAFLRQLGRGAFGVVWLAQDNHTAGLKVAMKVVDKRKHQLSGGSSQELFQEVTLLARLSHPQIIDVHAVMETPGHVLIALELAEGGDLKGLMEARGSAPRGLGEACARDCCHQILQGIAYLHRMGVAHRDLKPDNVLLQHHPQGNEPPLLKLADFGLAKAFGGKRATMNTICGTPAYVAPEVLQQQAAPQHAETGGGNGSGYNCNVDLWSLGIVLFEMLSGALPFRTTPGAPHPFQQILAAARPGFRCRPPPHCSAAAGQLLQMMVAPASRRCNAAQALQHSWLRPTGGPSAKRLKALAVATTQEDVDGNTDLDAGGRSAPRADRPDSRRRRPSGKGSGSGGGGGRRRHRSRSRERSGAAARARRDEGDYNTTALQRTRRG